MKEILMEVTVSIEGMTFRLLPNRGLYWPEQQTLFIADTHFGKEATFRFHSVAVPRGSTVGTLSTITAMVAECQAARLVLLGDMIHARSSLSQDVRDALDGFFEAHRHLRFALVPGNHDKGLEKMPKHWPIEIVAPGTQIGRLGVSHIPVEPSKGCDLVLCGHLHPAYRIYSQKDSVGKLPCFWLSRRQLVLPAMGEFTGTQTVKLAASDRIWIVADDQVVEIKHSMRVRS
jgi:uncharacterized protein